jgi:hypothetical protein
MGVDVDEASSEFPASLLFFAAAFDCIPSSSFAFWILRTNSLFSLADLLISARILDWRSAVSAAICSVRLSGKGGLVSWRALGICRGRVKEYVRHLNPFRYRRLEELLLRFLLRKIFTMPCRLRSLTSRYHPGNSFLSLPCLSQPASCHLAPLRPPSRRLFVRTPTTPR